MNKIVVISALVVCLMVASFVIPTHAKADRITAMEGLPYAESYINSTYPGAILVTVEGQTYQMDRGRFTEVSFIYYLEGQYYPIVELRVTDQGVQNEQRKNWYYDWALEITNWTMDSDEAFSIYNGNLSRTNLTDPFLVDQFRLFSNANNTYWTISATSRIGPTLFSDGSYCLSNLIIEDDTKTVRIHDYVYVNEYDFWAKNLCNIMLIVTIIVMFGYFIVERHKKYGKL